jgi:hypothetical protein
MVTHKKALQCYFDFGQTNSFSIQGESKKTDTFDIQMNNKGVSFFLLTLYT